jgi:hypothetical protein
MASVSTRHLGALRRSATRAGIVAFAASTTILLIALPASADCGLLDPGCLQTTANDTAGAVTGTAEDPAGTTNGAADDPVGTVTGPAGRILGQIGDTVDGLLGHGPGEPGGGGGGGPATPPGGGGPGHGSAGRPHHIPNRAPAPSAALIPNGGLGGEAPGASETRPPKHKNGLLGQIGGAVAGVAKRLGFPMALALLVFLFAALQNRLDRNEPRMVRASMVPDVMRFG